MSKAEIIEAVDKLIGQEFKVSGADDCVWLHDLRPGPPSSETHMTRGQAHSVGMVLVDVGEGEGVQEQEPPIEPPSFDQIDYGPGEDLTDEEYGFWETWGAKGFEEAIHGVDTSLFKNKKLTEVATVAQECYLWLREWRAKVTKGEVAAGRL